MYIHVWYIYLHLVNVGKIGKYTIHGSYGLRNSPFPVALRYVEGDYCDIHFPVGTGSWLSAGQIVEQIDGFFHGFPILGVSGS